MKLKAASLRAGRVRLPVSAAEEPTRRRTRLYVFLNEIAPALRFYFANFRADFRTIGKSG